MNAHYFLCFLLFQHHASLSLEYNQPAKTNSYIYIDLFLYELSLTRHELNDTRILRDSKHNDSCLLSCHIQGKTFLINPFFLRSLQSIIYICIIVCKYIYLWDFIRIYLLRALPHMIEQTFNIVFFSYSLRNIRIKKYKRQTLSQNKSVSHM